MKERPILFSGAMVRAILEGRKTVTRRAVKVQPFDLSWSRRDHIFEYTSGRAENGDEIDGLWAYTTRSGGQWEAKSPYGQPGDRLWVRESLTDLRGTGIEHRPDPAGPLQRYAFAADSPPGSASDEARKDFGIKWKPSIHMPRAACRILLEITNLRVERLQDISEEQALAEGIDLEQLADSQERYDMVADHNMTGRPTAVGAFRDLWASINGLENWDTNPWVWCVSFRRIEQ